jgi:hypothetical protein
MKQFLSFSFLFLAFTYGCQKNGANLVHGEIEINCIDLDHDSNDGIEVTVFLKQSIFEYDNKIKILAERPNEPSHGEKINQLVVNYHMPGSAMRGCGGVNTIGANIIVSENATENVIIQMISQDPITFTIMREDERPFYGPMRFLPDTEARIEWPREIEEV